MRTLPISSAQHMVRASLSPSRIVTVYGGRAWILGVRLAAQMACEDKPSLYLCGDNRFDPYAVAGDARRQKKSPEEALRRILVARAFTAYQLDELIHRLNPPITPLQTAPEIQPAHAESAFGVVIVSGLCTAFFDEDVTPKDAARLFYRSLWRLRDLSSQGLTLLLTQTEAPKHSPRAYFLADLFRASGVVMRLDGEQNFTLEDGRGRLPISE